MPFVGAATNDVSEAEIEGFRLAQKMREMWPAEDFVQQGVLKIFRKPAKPLEIPVRCRTVVTETNWSVTYSTEGKNNFAVEAFMVVHALRQPNEYRVLAGDAGQTNENKVLSGQGAWIPFAGSDFWLADLGLEFLHWPTQRILKKEMRRSCFCLVLESVNPQPAPGAYSRVVSWIDKDSRGIVHADAYDANGTVLKEFSPKDLTKIKGQWQVGELRIRNRHTDSRTRLEFDFKEE
jgi:hypothetical protein